MDTDTNTDSLKNGSQAQYKLAKNILTNAD